MSAEPLKLRVLRADLYVDPCTTRLPFGFGIATMTSAPLLTAQVEIETQGGARSVGFSADLLVPKWFEKDPRKSTRDDCAALFDSAKAAAATWCDPRIGAVSVFDSWWRVYRSRVHSTPQSASDRLVRGFGVALIERAVMDAACRATQQSFFSALRADLFAFQPGAVWPELAGWDLRASLAPTAAESILLRHTVGLTDPIHERDIESGSRVSDGLPQSLEAYVARHGLRVFKIKLCGKPERDLPRLSSIAELLVKCVPDGLQWTVDGNEQFVDLSELSELLDRLADQPIGRRFLESLLYVEQPLPRAQSFDAGNAQALATLGERSPVILDEADYGVEAFPRGLKLGYRGVSVKNCKGVFRALLNRGICEVRAEGAFQAAEDLTNLGVLALQQDLTTCAALGLTHVERNGHHYFHGLDHLPKNEAREALRVHAGLYEPLGQGATLKITQGALDLRSLQTVGYGYAVKVRTDERRALVEWPKAEAAP